MTQLVRVRIAFADDPNSVPSLHVGGLRTACNSQGSLMTLLVSVCSAFICSQRGMHTYADIK